MNSSTKELQRAENFQGGKYKILSSRSIYFNFKSLFKKNVYDHANTLYNGFVK